MGRRKKIFFGRSLGQRFEQALGFHQFQPLEEQEREALYAQAPKIRWDEVDANLTVKIHDYAKLEVDLAFEAEFGHRLRWASHAPPKPQTRLDEISEAEFFDKTKRVEVLAKKLAREVDELAEIGSVLVVRPKAKDGLTSAETPLDFYAKTTVRYKEVTEGDFADYLSFRKGLDYFGHFSQMNFDFQSIMGHRFDTMPDYSWYETFVRRVVLAFWPTDFPMTVTIPTDTNPTYQSPIILVLEELRRQFNEAAQSSETFAAMFENWSYRQHARLVIQLRDEFDEKELFWTFNALRAWENGKSVFGSN